VSTQTRASRILIVEDDADFRDTLAELLQFEGYQVTQAGNGREALAHLRQSAPPCLILLDLMMPEMNGWEFREAQRQDPALAQIPVAVVTGVRNDAQTLAAFGAVGYFQKPVNVSDLLTTVARYC
jgi:CheY-like chemotaxis protein